MIEAVGLRKAYGRSLAVDGITFTVERGEIFGLLGPNGAGKTTTMRMLSGLVRPDAGRVRIAGYDVVRQRRAALQRIGVAFELPALYPRLTVRENLEFAGALRGRPAREVAEVMERWGLAARERQRAGTLSRGWKQRTMIARASLGSPEALFLDEPTGGLDPGAAAEIHRILGTLRAEGVTVVMSTHDMAEATLLCDRVAIVVRGQLVAVDPPSALVGRLQSQAVEVTWWEAGGVHRTALALEDPATPAAVWRLMTHARVLEIHTTGSLETVYRQLTAGEKP